MGGILPVPAIDVHVTGYRHVFHLGGCALLMMMTGCAELGIPSARFAAPQPTPAAATYASATQESVPTRAQVPPAGAIATDQNTPATKCLDGGCPLLTFFSPLSPLACKIWPLGRHRQEESLLDTEMPSPLPRFHPVPVQPVFAPRVDYEPPQPLAVPSSHPLHAPQLLPK